MGEVHLQVVTLLQRQRLWFKLQSGEREQGLAYATSHANGPLVDYYRRNRQELFALAFQEDAGLLPACLVGPIDDWLLRNVRPEILREVGLRPPPPLPASPPPN